METAIKVENLSKIYRLGEIGTGTISRDLERFFKMKILKQEDPFLRIGEANDRATKGASDLVYSLKNINFEIKQGDAVGIIGRNGAGKSTLLKILSRVTSPTTGNIKIKGRVASLLEVGTGFHPELTGRENIYLNGAILGMRKKEIDRKFDEIVDFSGVERYIDTPVKRYSSGMYVRLAFAVAAHLESEILIVDEVLAVGDAEFQKKCLGKMGEISKGEGRTILFVSHNMSAIQKMCNKSILMQNGTVIKIGDTESVIPQYINQENKTISLDLSKITERQGDQKLIIANAFFVQKNSKSNQLISLNETELHILYKINNINVDYREIRIDIGINDLYGTRVGWFSSWNKNHNVDKNKSILIFKIKNFNLTPGEYNCNLFLGYNGEVADFIQEVNPFTVIENDYFKTGKAFPQNQGFLLFNYEIIN
jgi:lipopolysaccharide transport system ATP-binding protein